MIDDQVRQLNLQEPIAVGARKEGGEKDGALIDPKLSNMSKLDLQKLNDNL